eukprot:Skav233657  [mRNA]  locus=scaffold2779:998872:1000149:- [translate_table: standard]
MATALPKQFADHAQGRRVERHLQVGEFLPQTEPLSQGVQVDAWATVFFQVFWWPHDLPDMKNLGKQGPVLLGEAVCPPMSSLGPSFQAHRLRLHQFQRKPPIDVASFESWQVHLEEYVQSLKQKCQEKHEVDLVDSLSEVRRQEDLSALERDLMLAFPKSCPKLPKHTQPAPAESPMVSKANGSPLSQRNLPMAIPSDENSLLKDLPARYRGHCCLDVDLAFVGPADPCRVKPGHDGTLAFDVRSLRVPPLDHGYVSLRLCEAAILKHKEPQMQGGRSLLEGATENGAALERKILQNREMEAAQLSWPRALWSSGSVLLGSWAGSMLAPCCTAMWTTRKASASLWISSQKEIVRAAKQDTLPETAREMNLARKARTFAVPVSNHWCPVQFVTAGEPLPRCRELFFDRDVGHWPSGLKQEVKNVTA